ncbi:MAG: carboxypeptidase regulatory-like domain-containing protein [Planctomycetes bacterium]|nr:carboxypeptidase regulatory-like domain-containing protein [Planctomycetota bacterium]
MTVRPWFHLGIAAALAALGAIFYFLFSTTATPSEALSRALHSEAPRDERLALASEGPSVVRGDAASTALEASPSADDLRIRVIDEASGERRIEHAVVVAGRKQMNNAYGFHSLLRGTPAGAERELRVPRASVAEVPDLTELLVLIDGCFDPPLDRTIPIVPWPTEPVEILIPPCGRVGVRVYDEKGLLHEGAQKVHVKMEFPGGRQTIRSILVEQGTTTTFVCALHMELELSALGVAPEPMFECRARGPRRAGETKWIEMRPPEAASSATIGVRLLTDRGEVLRSRAVSFAREHRMQTPTRPIVKTVILSQTSRDDGCIEVAVEPQQRGEESRLELQVSFLDAERGYLRGSLVVPTPLAPGHSELGDLVLQPSEIAIAGVVVDAHDQPVRGAWISLRELHDETARLEGPDRGSLSTDAQGRFSLVDISPQRALLLQARAAGHQPSPIVEARAGDKELVMRLGASASVAGSIRCPESFPWQEVSVAVVRPEASLSLVPTSAHTSVMRDKSFLVSSAPSGVVSLRFDHPAAGLLATIDGIELRAGETSRDPRLQQVPLLLGGRPFSLRLVDARNPLAEIVGAALRAESDARAIPLVLEKREHRAWIRLEEEHFTLHVPGYRSRRVAWQRETQTLALDPALRVFVPVEATLAPAHERIEVQLIDPDGVRAAEAPVIDGLAELRVGASGSYRVELELVLRGNLPGGRIRIPLPTPLAIEVDDRPRQELAPVVIAPQLLRALLLPR